MSSEVAVEMHGGKRERYPKYKDSGVEWLGDVPAHWCVLPIKRIVTIPVTDGPHETPEILDEGIPFVSAEAIRNNRIDFDRKRGYISESEHRRFCLKYHPKRNDIYMIKSGATTGNLAIVETDEEFSIWSPLAVIRVHSKKADARFVLSAMNSREFQTSVQLFWSFGTQQNIGMNVIENLSLPIPPFPEQHSIAAFLDRETGRIDTLIEKKERQDELLQEKRAALISHAVTKGLDPDVKMKDSGVEWLGEVPEGWNVRKLKHIASVKFSNVDKKTEEGEHPVYLCNYVDVYYNDYITSNLDLMKATASVAEIQKFTLGGGDILITKDSESWDDIAIPAYVSSDINNVLCGYHLAQIRPNISLSDGEYLFRSFYARGINDQFRVAATGVTRYGLGKYWLDNSLFLVPPLSEQRAIAAFLDRETGRIDTLTTKVHESISKLREYRTALISAAVTGKIDVRNKET